MHRVAIELTRRVLAIRVELTPEPTGPRVVETTGVTIAETLRPLAKTSVGNVIPFRRTAGVLR